jgi:enoyl-CoA hydratase/carnithine racemase
MHLSEYQDRFTTAAVSRDQAGVLTIRLHSKGEALWWGRRPHRELPELFAAVSSDRENRVVILTGTGESFITIRDLEDREALERLPHGRVNATGMERTTWEGNRLINELLDINVPMIAAVNGPVIIHSELAVLCDIVLCTPDSYFQDHAHFPLGMVPGDGVHVIWPMLLGPNRGRSFLLTGATLGAEEALRLGVVSEVVPRDDLIGRARELAEPLASLNPVLLRHTRHVLTRPIKREMAHDLHLGLALESIAALSGKEWFDSDAAGAG